MRCIICNSVLSVGYKRDTCPDCIGAAKAGAPIGPLLPGEVPHEIEEDDYNDLPWDTYNTED